VSRLFASIFLLIVAGSSSLAAADLKVGGHVKYQYTYTDYRSDDLNAILGEDPARDQGIDVRLKAEAASGPWDATMHYEFLGIHGDSLSVRRRLLPLGLAGGGTATGLPDDQRRLFDLTTTVTDKDRTAAVQRLDRLALGYSGSKGTIRFGRQALSWGNGLVFQPLDFINPFSPIAIDKEYKTGDDMLYLQSAPVPGRDIQAIVVPRRDPATHEIEGDQSTYAVKLRLRVREIDFDILGARHFGDNLAGLGMVRSIGGAVWRFDALYTDSESGRDFWSAVTNLDYSWVWGGKNYYGYAEYFRSGVGESDRADYSAPNAALAARIERGELFTLARDYAALGLQVELHPLFNLFNNVIWNLNDGSAFVQIRGIYDWRQNVQLMAGVNGGFGDRGDEYGGIPAPGTNAFVAPGRSVFVRAAYYF
jgi:hypothetical protein